MDLLVEIAKKRAVNGMEMFLRNFSKVPDDRLNWTPTPTAKSALRVGAHTALYMGRFAKMIRDRKLPQSDNIDVWVAKNVAEEEAVTSREEMERIFREGIEEVVRVLEGLTSEDLEIQLDSGQGFTMAMKDFINLPGWHATLHTGQIDYLQTCWGDQQIYV